MVMTCEEGEEHYKYRIVDACDELHGWATQGNPMGMCLHEIVELRDWLQKRLDHWSWAPDPSVYDRTIRQLAETVIFELHAKFAELAKPQVVTIQPNGHGYTPPGFAPCTREPGHDGPCAHYIQAREVGKPDRRDDSRAPLRRQDDKTKAALPLVPKAQVPVEESAGPVWRAPTLAPESVRYRCCHCRAMNDHRPGEAHTCTCCGSSTFEER